MQHKSFDDILLPIMRFDFKRAKSQYSYLLMPIIYNSDQFDNMLRSLNETVEINEKSFINLLNQYEETVKTFEEFQKILDEIKQLDERMKILMI